MVLIHYGPRSLLPRGVLLRSASTQPGVDWSPINSSSHCHPPFHQKNTVHTIALDVLSKMQASQFLCNTMPNIWDFVLYNKEFTTFLGTKKHIIITSSSCALWWGEAGFCFQCDDTLCWRFQKRWVPWWPTWSLCVGTWRCHSHDLVTSSVLPIWRKEGWLNSYKWMSLQSWCLVFNNHIHWPTIFCNSSSRESDGLLWHLKVFARMYVCSHVYTYIHTYVNVM